MARAKRTDRAEARRRYRAATAGAIDDRELDGAIDEETDVEPAAVPATRTARAAATVPDRGAPQRPARPGVFSAFRAAFRPLDLRADLRSLPQLLLSRAFLAPTVASGAAFVWFVLAPSEFSILAYQYFSYQFPLAAVFVAGFFAPRASWLIGGMVAVASTLFQLPFLGFYYSPEVIVGLVIQNAFFGALFAAAAAWYRRFLNLANPNRGRPAPAPTARRPDGKVPRRNEPRPILARRR